MPGWKLPNTTMRCYAEFKRLGISKEAYAIKCDVHLFVVEHMIKFGQEKEFERLQVRKSHFTSKARLSTQCAFMVEALKDTSVREFAIRSGMNRWRIYRLMSGEAELSLSEAMHMDFHIGSTFFMSPEFLERHYKDVRNVKDTGPKERKVGASPELGMPYNLPQAPQGTTPFPDLNAFMAGNSHEDQ